MKKFGRCGNGAVDETEGWRFSTIDELTEVVRSFDCEVCAVMTGTLRPAEKSESGLRSGFSRFRGRFPRKRLEHAVSAAQDTPEIDPESWLSCGDQAFGGPRKFCKSVACL
jgi:hypothetical protein